MKYNDVKFSELVKDTLNVKDLSNVIGGRADKLMVVSGLTDGCDSGICTTKIVASYCNGGAVCTHGIG